MGLTIGVIIIFSDEKVKPTTCSRKNLMTFRWWFVSKIVVFIVCFLKINIIFTLSVTLLTGCVVSRSCM